MSNTKITIENVRTGARKQVSEMTWQLMSNPSNQGDVRKGYRLVHGIAGAPAPVKKNPAPTFVPPEIEEAARKQAEADRKREAEMISGVKASEEVAPATAPASATQETVEAPAPTASAQGPSAKAEGPTGTASSSEELKGLPGVTAKVLEVLSGIGITTAAQLAKASTADINKALAEANLAAKAAQVPGWKTKAAQLATTNA